VRNVLEVHHAAAVGFDAGYQTTAAQPRDDPRFSSWLLITVTVVQGIPTMGIPTMTKCLGACAMQSSSTYLGGWREHPSELRKLIGDVIEVSRTARTPVKAAPATERTRTVQFRPLLTPEPPKNLPLENSHDSPHL
jgi:hypothetical protein